MKPYERSVGLNYKERFWLWVEVIYLKSKHSFDFRQLYTMNLIVINSSLIEAMVYIYYAESLFDASVCTFSSRTDMVTNLRTQIWNKF